MREKYDMGLQSYSNPARRKEIEELALRIGVTSTQVKVQ